MEARTASSGNEWRTVSFWIKAKKKIFFFLTGICTVWKNQIDKKHKTGT